MRIVATALQMMQNHGWSLDYAMKAATSTVRLDQRIRHAKFDANRYAGLAEVSRRVRGDYEHVMAGASCHPDDPDGLGRVVTLHRDCDGQQTEVFWGSPDMSVAHQVAIDETCAYARIALREIRQRERSAPRQKHSPLY